ncbi:MAG: DegV domain-containing protein [Firmicutes bacterium ADurb.Bin373]|nr:MAG: DegV domain-containing protein [Firmicutes bacterium ADurb.Bin373]
MNQVKIVTDSTADLPPDLAAKYNITVVPLMVIFNDNEIFRDGVDIDTGQFYRRQIERKEYSRTSQPAPAEFLSIYKELSSSGSSVISIHLSSALSGACQSARMARDMLPGADIAVIDSKLASMGLGMIALEAARAAGAGKNKDEILRIVRQMISEGMLYFIVDTLEYLARGGRIGKAQALLGNILSIKPILYLKDGVVHPLEKTRGRAKAIDRLAQIVEKKVGQRRVKCALMHGMDPVGMRQLYENIMPLLNCDEPVCSTLGAVIGTHTGMGALGIAIFPD